MIRPSTFLAFALIALALAQTNQDPTTTSQLQLAITFDDLPAHGPLPPGVTRIEVAGKIIRALQAAHLPPSYGFVNAADLQQHPEDLAVLQAWRDAGNPLGNHTWSHMNLNLRSIEDYKSEIERDEPVLKQLMGNDDWRWFRYPFLAEGDTPQKRDAARAFLLQHGYKIAAVTMSFADYSWNEPYARCLTKTAAQRDAKAIATLQTTYLDAATQNITFYRTLSQSLLNREIPYVLLMHIGAFDAEMLPRLLDLYRSKGFDFITLPQAESDNFYKVDTDAQAPSAPDSLEGLAAGRHIPLPPRPSMDEQLQSLCR